jgi:hypothetical protein
MSPSYVNVLVDEIETQLENATSAINLLEREGPAVIRILVNSYLDTIPLVPGAMKNEIDELLIARLLSACKYSKEVIKGEEKLAHMLGNPDRLRAAASTIDRAVTTGSQNLSTDVRPDSLEAMSDDSQWKGGASQLYAKSFIGQSEAVDHISTNSAVLADTLNKMADAIEQFYIGLSIGIIGLVAAILAFVGAVLAAVTIVAIPAAIIAAIAGAVTAIGAEATLVATFFNEIQGMSDDIGALHTKMKAWPSAHFAS